ncbi:hypothetical protein GGI24_004084 [Coemansia furcata]|nr:hypothetical protein GGI24_004084 [Coemansia furcata]
MVIPQNITAGDYRMRVEVIDLRNAATNGNLDPSMGPHFYVNCAMLTVTNAGTGTGTTKPSLVAIESVYKNSKGLFIDGSNPGQAAAFKIPGPSAYPSS